MTAMDWFNVAGMSIVLILGIGALTTAFINCRRAYRVWRHSQLS